ncbi:uncharacterized protein LOC127712221 isoform X2 [Mytilus californianus]|uniref:uncharacterized protein LOC127712221 isoform X2 n=1 Tax=Mytilus californianus TaxID=6549 RepID=UPI0022473430|nr:uncharacterized protein LOC127712221 isoform X2 [Mytilus californianus]
MGSSEKPKTLLTNKGSSENSKTLSTSKGSSEKSKTLSTSMSSSEKLKTLSTSMGSSENSNTLSTSMGSSENSNILSTSMGSLENSKTLATSMGSFVKAEKQQWKCQLCQKISKDCVKKKNGQHICKGCDSLFSGEDNWTDGGENMEKEPEGKKEEKINPHDTVITGGIHGKRNKKYRPYSTSTMAAAYKAVIDDKLSIRSSSKIHGVPFQTLRDRVTGNIDPECTTMGNAPLFTLDEESRLVTHLMEMGELGYGYYRQDVLDIATDYAITLDLKTKNEKPLSLAWFCGMIKRWPDLKVVKQRALEVVKANTANKENISKYFNELEKALLRNNLIDKPHLIYNVDEKSVAISGKGERVTILGCGNAIGNALPPFFIFPGQKMDDKLVEGSSPGTVGTVSKTGESNSDIFMDFLHNHFMKIVPDTGFVLLLLDGHTSHIPVGTFEWARNHNIVLQLIPAHTSHFLQPLDVGCYGLLQDIYNSLCHKTIRTKNCALDHNDVCPMVCKAYKNALSTNNLQSAFRKTGIYPFTKDVMDLPLEPSEALCLSDTTNIEESQDENMIDLHFLNEDNSS